MVNTNSRKRKESNVIYSAPARVIAAGANRNLVQAAIIGPNRIKLEQLERLEKVLSFGEDLRRTSKGNGIIVIPQEPREMTRGIVQGSFSVAPSVSLKDIKTLEKVLEFGRK
jgi:hypothetical protein